MSDATPPEEQRPDKTPDLSREAFIKQLEILRQHQEAAGAMFPQMERMLLAFFQASSEHVRVVVTIGYASFFAIWALTAAYMSPGQRLWAAVLMIVSVGSFVANEIMNVVAFNRMGEAMREQIGSGKLSDQLREIQTFTTRMTKELQLIKRFRPSLLGTSLLSGLLALLVMVDALVSGLWMVYGAP